LGWRNDPAKSQALPDHVLGMFDRHAMRPGRIGGIAMHHQMLRILVRQPESRLVETALLQKADSRARWLRHRRANAPTRPAHGPKSGARGEWRNAVVLTLGDRPKRRVADAVGLLALECACRLH